MYGKRTPPLHFVPLYFRAAAGARWRSPGSWRARTSLVFLWWFERGLNSDYFFLLQIDFGRAVIFPFVWLFLSISKAAYTFCQEECM